MTAYTLQDLLNDDIETNLSWDEFSPIVKGMPRKQKSALWTAYKEEDIEVLVSVYESIQDGTFSVEEEAVEEEAAEEEAAEEEAVDKEITEENIENLVTHLKENDYIKEEEVVEEEAIDYLVEFTKLSNKLIRFGPSMKEEAIIASMVMMKDYANKTLPAKYEVENTDAWEIWMGPTSKCLLVNATRQFSFSCSRAWWSKNYLNAMYVSRQLVHTEEQFNRLVSEKAATNKFLDRHPLPGIEIMLPTTAREFHLRD